MTSTLVQYERDGRVGRITLHRPEKLNAVTDDVVVQLRAAFKEFDADEDAWVGLLSGAGRAFCSGADVHQRQSRTPEEFRRLGGPEGPNASAVDVMSGQVNWKPVVAAVHGYVLGMGLLWMLESEYIVAAAGTQMQLTETRRGVSALPLVEAMRYRGAGSFADEVGITGRYFTAEEAERALVVDKVVPEGQHIEAAEAVIDEILKNPPLAVRAVVRSRRRAMDQAIRQALFDIAPLRLYLTDDFRESAAAFREKRPTRPFTGR